MPIDARWSMTALGQFFERTRGASALLANPDILRHRSVRSKRANNGHAAF
jgi:hypothetical protein